MDPLLEANGTFALNLLKILGEDSSKNVFFSPLSISATLAMVFMGTKGNTASQMAQALSLDKCSRDGGGDVHQGFQALLAEVNKTGTRYLLRTASGLFGEKSYDILSSFKDSCYKFYGAEVEELDFMGAPEKSRTHINTWVAKKTEDKITELLSSDAVDPNTVLALVNAVYFKGNWETQFNKEHTGEMPFITSKNEQKPVQMMFQKSTFKTTFVEEIDTEILMLPYVGQELNMIILLPGSDTDLRTVEKKITYKNLMEWTRRDTYSTLMMNVFLPRFKLKESYNMEEVLQSLGMSDAFDNVRAEKGFCLSTVMHESFMEVNEEGTEAVAATAAVISTRSMSPTFCANHPFLFFIQHSKTKAILFCGRFSSP